MLALYIILGVVLLLFALCFVKLKFSATYDEALNLKLKVLFLQFTLVPAKKKKPQKAKTKKKTKKESKKSETDKNDKKKKPSYLKKLSEKKGISGLLSIFVELSKLVGTTLKGIFSNTVVTTFDLDIKVSGDDAADTALKYGKLCGVIYSAVNIICNATKTQDYNLNVSPDFDDEAKSKITCDVRFYIRVFYVLKYLFKALVKLLVIRYKR